MANRDGDVAKWDRDMTSGTVTWQFGDDVTIGTVTRQVVLRRGQLGQYDCSAVIFVELANSAFGSPVRISTMGGKTASHLALHACLILSAVFL